MRGKDAPRRGQAVVEFALIVPVLVLLMLGAVDLGRAFYLTIEIAGSSRAGMRNGLLDTATDIGAAARAEPNSAIPNDATTWGLTGPGALNSDCTSATQRCGDPNGCAPNSFAAGQIACFAIRPCTVNVSGICVPAATWGGRPLQGADQGLQVRVVYKFVPVTPLISNLTGAFGAFYLTSDTGGLQLY